MICANPIRGSGSQVRLHHQDHGSSSRRGIESEVVDDPGPPGMSCCQHERWRSASTASPSRGLSRRKVLAFFPADTEPERAACRPGSLEKVLALGRAKICQLHPEKLAEQCERKSTLELRRPPRENVQSGLVSCHPNFLQKPGLAEAGTRLYSYRAPVPCCAPHAH